MPTDHPTILIAAEHGLPPMDSLATDGRFACRVTTLRAAQVLLDMHDWDLAILDLRRSNDAIPWLDEYLRYGRNRRMVVVSTGRQMARLVRPGCAILFAPFSAQLIEGLLAAPPTVDAAGTVSTSLIVVVMDEGLSPASGGDGAAP